MDHAAFAPVLDSLGGPDPLANVDGSALAAYVVAMAEVHPSELDRDEGLAYWLNLYNAGAVSLAVTARRSGEDSVLRVPGAFDTTVATVGGEALSLNDIEHGKIRRYADPRIHAALVCGSVSCPTLRSTPFVGRAIDTQLDEQFRAFADGGGVVADRDRGVLVLSRVFLWYGADFVRPYRMPTLLPARSRSVAEAVARLVDTDLARWVGDTAPKVEYLAYDWGLGCSLAG